MSTIIRESFVHLHSSNVLQNLYEEVCFVIFPCSVQCLDENGFYSSVNATPATGYQ